MNRRNTSFAKECKSYLDKAIETSDSTDKLLFHQKLAYEFSKTINKGLYLWHDMGLGKTIESIAIASMYRSMGYAVIILTAKSLQNNYKKGIKEYNALMKDNPNFNPVDESSFNFVVKSHIINKNIAKILSPQNVIEGDRTAVRINKITQKTLIVIDEAHQISQLIANGSDEWRSFYDVVLRSPLAKIIMLSGSLFSSSPFELVPICNMLSGEELFPENIEQFMSAFWNNKEKVMKNRGIFQNRIYGLFSYMKLTYLEKETVNFYPKVEPIELVNCPMNEYQFESYIIAREKEIQEKKAKGEKSVKPVVKKFESLNKESSSYRVRSRQYSNFAPPPEVEEIYNKPDYTIDELTQVMKKTPSNFFETTKYNKVHEIATKHSDTGGLIYSQFTGIGGGGSLAESFIRKGYEEFTVKSEVKKSKAFAVVNGSMSIEDQDKIVQIYNSPDNDDGSIIHFLIVGIQQTTGLDLKCKCWVVMLEPYWGIYIWEQLLARLVRYKSHERMDYERRVVYPYIMISTYPDSVDERILAKRETKITTDQHLYKAMMSDKIMSEQFKLAVSEVAIECEFVKNQNPDHICRTCAADNQPLYTTDMNANQSIEYDMARCDPCDLRPKEEVKAVVVSYNDSEYYAVKDTNRYGYLIYYKDGEEYEELTPSSPMFKAIIAKLDEQKK